MIVARQQRILRCSATTSGTLASAGSKVHIDRMATHAPESIKRKPAKDASRVLGRSAATGSYVLRPAPTKGGSITLREARSAVKNLASKK